MRYNTVLFDADGTLIDFLKCEDEAVREAMEMSGIQPTDELVSVYSEINDSLWKKLELGEIEREVLVYHRFELFCERFGFSTDAKKMSREYRERLGTKAHMFDGAEELLKRLSGKVRIFIVTNGVEPTQSNRMALSCLPEYAENIFISGIVGYEKPNIKYFERVAKNIKGFDKANTVIVGDSLSSDIKGGIGFGIDTCWYNPSAQKVPEGMNITHIATSFDDIYNIIIHGEK